MERTPKAEREGEGSLRISAPELSTEITASREQEPPAPLRVRASEPLQLEVASCWSLTVPEGLPIWSCDPPAAGTFSFDAGLETGFYVADPLWRGTLTITARKLARRVSWKFFPTARLGRRDSNAPRAGNKLARE